MIGNLQKYRRHKALKYQGSVQKGLEKWKYLMKIGYILDLQLL